MKILQGYLLKPLLVIFLFFIAYSSLGIVRHNFYGSFGADLGFMDELIWRYSHFDFSQVIGGSHIEFTSVILAPLYWIWSDPRMLIIFQSLSICSSGLAVFLLARRRKLKTSLCYVLLLSYLTFFGVQNALWFDVHTSVWGAAFFTWFIYFLDNDNRKASIIAFLLTIGSKENMAAYVLLYCGVYFLMTRKKEALFFLGGSVIYLFLIFWIIFPATLTKGYDYSNQSGLVSGSPLQLFDTDTKRQTLFYTFAWVGFVPFILPLFVIPILGDLGSYFILGRSYVAAHDVFMHYRVDLIPLLISATIFALARYKWLNTKYVAAYLLLCFVVLQYTMHLPLSYLAKRWFWTQPSGVASINKILTELPKNSSVAVQDNIYPHVSQRKSISLLWPDTRTFKKDSPCGQPTCPWLRWTNNPQYLVVDLSPEWDIRHLLQQNQEFTQAVKGLEKEGVIELSKSEGSSRIYKVLKKAK